MEHALARDSAAHAAHAKIFAMATLHATATAFGVKEADQGLNHFMREMDAIIQAAGPQAEHNPAAPSPEEIAYFDRIAAIAEASRTK